MGATAKTIGVFGYTASNSGVGIYGQTISACTEGGNHSYPAGVWGDSPFDIGVLATVDDSNALVAYNNSSTYTALYVGNDTHTSDAEVFSANGGFFGGNCKIDVTGHLSCNGTLSAVVPVDNGSHKVALYAVEASENWFEDFGSGRLSGGEAVIDLEPTFRQTVNTGMDYHVFLTPRGECEGLYIANATAANFEVRELHHGSSSVAFDYRIVARRKGYENLRLADKTKQFDIARPKPAATPGTRPPSAQQIRARNRQMLMRPVTQVSKPNSQR